jgi:hypothetical protein
MRGRTFQIAWFSRHVLQPVASKLNFYLNDCSIGLPFASILQSFQKHKKESIMRNTGSLLSTYIFDNMNPIEVPRLFVPTPIADRANDENLATDDNEEALAGDDFRARWWHAPAVSFGPSKLSN